jgi:tRNA uridine 5-carbamoylmethylation protein Kti12
MKGNKSENLYEKLFRTELELKEFKDGTGKTVLCLNFNKEDGFPWNDALIQETIKKYDIPNGHQISFNEVDTQDQEGNPVKVSKICLILTTNRNIFDREIDFIHSETIYHEVKYLRTAGITDLTNFLYHDTKKFHSETGIPWEHL